IWAVANGRVCEAVGRRWVLAPDAAGHIFPAGAGAVGMQPGREGGSWFYNYGNGLVHVSADGAVRRFTAADGFPGDRVYCGFVDKEGDLWTGWDAGGLVRTRKAQFHTVNLAAKKAAKSVSEDAQGAIWIGLLSGGLDCLRNQALTNLPAPDGTATGPAYCVCPDREGRLWASGQDEDLYVRDGCRFTRVMPVVNRVKAILAARNGRVWIGTTSGLYFSDGPSDQVHFFPGMARHSVRALAEDGRGTLWAGSGNGDLYHIVGDKVSEFHPPNEQESDAIWSVLPEDDGTVWVGTFRDGLMRFRGGKFFRYGKANGLPDNVICQILDDGAGNLWIGSHRGVFRIAKLALNAVASGKQRFATCVAYGRSDGLPSLECSGGFQPSGWRGAHGRLWFATSRGVAWVQPRDIHPDLTPPPVVIEAVLVDGQLQTNFVSEQNDPVLDVPPGNHQIEVHYTGLSLVSPEHVQFRYQLEGVNTAWVQAGTRRFAQYSFLPPGKYRFRVVACNSDGVWNKTGSEFTLIIPPFYYQTWWFQALAMAAILCVVAGGARRLATRRLHAKMEQLERHKAVERERARIAKDIHDDLGASLTLIAVLGDLAKREKTNERIERMSGTARDAVKSLDEIVWAVNPRNDTLSHLVDYTGQFSAGYLRDAGIRCLLEVPDHLPAREVPANARHNVFLAVKEALQNIVKHARATEVLLRVDADGDNLHLTLEDNGCGFEQAADDPWADGLRNMRQRLAEVGGTCRIDSRRGAGTTIRIDLPLPSGTPRGGRNFIR
ncbi:MAG: two-component regulator propeller domain-containing protein, partial [Limisphaerales bacterium]